MVFTEILLFILFGCLLGILTGLTPGLHINTVAIIIVSISGILTRFSTIAVISAIVSMAVVHSFLDFIPSILLGAPDEESVLSVLPGHKLLLSGEAIEAIKLTAVGSLISLLIISAFSFVLIFTIPKVYLGVEYWIKFILIFLVLFGILLEKYPVKALGIFLLSGIFGFLLLNNSFTFNVVFPALSGLFGISTLVLSIGQEIFIPEQRNCEISLKLKKILKHSAFGTVAGMLVGLLPGIGAAQATYFLQQTTKASEKEFLVSISGVNTANIIMTLIVLYTIGKTRSGIAIVVRDLTLSLTFFELLLIVCVVLIAGGIATILHLRIGTYVAKEVGSLDPRKYRRLNFLIILLISVLVFLTSGTIGIFVMMTGVFIGILPPLINVRRSHCMGFLIFPVLMYYFSVSLLILNVIY